MAQHNPDSAPGMITFALGEEGDQLVLSIPETSISTLDSATKEATLRTLARFVVTLGNGGEPDTLIDDLATIAKIDGMILTIPGSEHPLSIQELFGSLVVSGSTDDVAQLQSGTGSN